MSSDKAQTLAAKLKDEGNALFVKKDYQAAYKKYSEAIEKDGSNAVLYSNRAACSLNQRKFLDAESDAKKATQLDSTYSKAWARLAAANAGLANDEESLECWRKALATVPIESLSPAEVKQKEQYQSELKSMERKIRDMKSGTGAPRSYTMASAAGRTPWQRAMAVEADIQARGEDAYKSSAWVILGAYAGFMQGVEKMKSTKKIPTPGGPGFVMMGIFGALDDISNGILRDNRVFHISEPNWIQLYNNQVILETQQSRAWVEGGPQLVITEVLKRQRSEGWDAARTALSTTIRCWIMRGFMEDTIRNNPDTGAEFIGRAVEVLQWGSDAWRDVLKEDKGVIFSVSFIRGVRSLYLETYMKAFSIDSKKFPLKILYEQSRDLLKDCESPLEPPSGPVDPGFTMSFTQYAKGRALSMIGLYHTKMAPLSIREGADSVQGHYRQAAQSYHAAADEYPKDDENHIWFLNSALQNYWLCGTPLRITLPIMERIRLGIPDMKKIWEHSALAKGGRDSAFQKALWAEEDCRKEFADGIYDMDS